MITRKARQADFPTFVAGDLSLLPPITFNDIDVSTLLTKMEKLQTDFEQLKAAVAVQATVCEDIRAILPTTRPTSNNNKTNDRECDCVIAGAGDHAGAGAGAGAGARARAGTRAGSGPGSGAGDSATPALPHNHGDQFDLQVRLPALDVSDDWPMLGQAHDNTHSANEGADWTTVARRPKRQRAAADGAQPVTKQHRPTTNSTNRENAKRQKQPRRQNGIVGKNASSGIPTCKKMKFANIFTSRFGPDLEATASDRHEMETANTSLTSASQPNDR